MPRTRRPDVPTTRKAGDTRNTHRYQVVRRTVLQQEPACWLRLPGCTTHTTTADHIITVDECLRLDRPDLITSRDNLRGACAHCNTARGDKPIDAIRHLMGQADAQPLRVFD